jgi:cellulose biosynthesis protein BcsQ
MKGGVGKTTTVIMLAETLAIGGASVLVVDLDPQASASMCLAGDDRLAELITKGRTLDAYFSLRLIDRERANLPDMICTNVGNTTHAGQHLKLSLLAAGPALRIVEREIIYEMTKRKYSFNAIEGHVWKLFVEEVFPLSKNYEFVVFDCSPGISAINEVAIRGSDLVVVPSIPDFLSTKGLNMFCQSLWIKTGSSTLPKPKRLPHVLVTRWQKNVKKHQEMIEQMIAEAEAADAGFNLFKTKVPQSAKLAGAMDAFDETAAEMPTLPFKQKYGDLIPQVLAPLVDELKEIFGANRH